MKLFLGYSQQDYITLIFSILDSIVKWVYKLENTDESKLNGPFTSLQMLEKAEKGEFKETGVWCRKLEESAETAFYNSKRIDFDLYT